MNPGDILYIKKLSFSYKICLYIISCSHNLVYELNGQSSGACSGALKQMKTYTSGTVHATACLHIARNAARSARRSPPMPYTIGSTAEHNLSILVLNAINYLSDKLHRFHVITAQYLSQ